MHTEKIKWLHLSDFHVGQDDYGQTQLFKSILKHVSEQKERGITPDYIFVTGDLAYKGAASEYIKFNTDFLEPLQKIIGNGIENRTFTVPGNHDVDRNKASGFSAEKFLNSSNNYFNPTQEGMEQRKPIFERFKGFADFDLTPTLGEWITSSEGAYSFEENIKGVNVGIVGINTAWLSEKINEAKMLSPGKFIVENILSKVDKNDLVIVLGHHPLDWFAEGHRRPIESLFGKNNVLYLHGHLHDVWVTPQYGGGHMFLPIQCGAAFQAREDGFYKNGLLWTEVDITSGLISLQPWTWNTVHQEWGINSEAFPSVNKKGDFWEFLLPTKKNFLQ